MTYKNLRKNHGMIDDGSTIIFHTDWQKNLNKKSYFMKNPGLAISAAKYLASKKINLVGIDCHQVSIWEKMENFLFIIF